MTRAGSDHRDLVLGAVLSDRRELLGIADLLEARAVYLAGHRTAFVILDNSCQPDTQEALRRLVARRQDCVLLASTTRQPMRGGLYHSISRCMLHALERFRFRCFLKLDPDSLLTGFGLVEALHRYFEANPRAGLLGSYRYNCVGRPRDFSNWKPVFEEEADLWRPFLEQLAHTDYVPGEHVQGGAMAYSGQCLQALRDGGRLADPCLQKSKLCEDGIFSLLVRVCGFEIHSFVDDGMPFAIAYRGLPLSPLEIRRRRKSVIHSVKFKPRDRLIRWFFRTLRYADAARAAFRQA